MQRRFCGVAIEMAGAVGSVESPEVYGGPISRTPQQFLSVNHPAGCRTLLESPGGPDVAGTGHVPLGYTGETEAFGDDVAKSVITAPSPQAPLNHAQGLTVISGLAWSGRGRIARVDVSLDGGRNWTTARLDGPVWDKALTRFYHEINWDGRELLLQSRAIDETGYVQPTKAELRRHRGVNSIYHNNGIQTWHVKTSGEVENVEVG